MKIMGKIKIRVASKIINNKNEVIEKGDIVTINKIWSNDSNTILYCEIQKDDIVIFTRLKEILKG
jgi:hypothetical protein